MTRNIVGLSELLTFYFLSKEQIFSILKIYFEILFCSFSIIFFLLLYFFYLKYIFCSFSICLYLFFHLWFFLLISLLFIPLFLFHSFRILSITHVFVFVRSPLSGPFKIHLFRVPSAKAHLGTPNVPGHFHLDKLHLDHCLSGLGHRELPEREGVKNNHCILFLYTSWILPGG